jgi:hypothetical protein
VTVRIFQSHCILNAYQEQTANINPETNAPVFSSRRGLDWGIQEYLERSKAEMILSEGK